jgi:hypothetical protein
MNDETENLLYLKTVFFFLTSTVITFPNFINFTVMPLHGELQFLIHKVHLVYKLAYVIQSVGNHMKKCHV